MSEKSMKAIVSVVIPVHNAAEYIVETLDTILSQSLKEIEIIIVNDNSSDDTLDIIKYIADTDPRVQIINNLSNIGGGASRNRGLKLATGEYIIFLDDDDFANQDMLKQMSDRAIATQADVVVCRCQSYDLQTLSYVPMPSSVREDLLPEREVFSSQEITHDFFRAFIWWPWDKLFRRQAILDLGLQFQPLRTTNDLFFVSSFMLMAKRVSLLDEILISHTVNRSESLSATRAHSWHCALDALTALHNFMQSHGFVPLRTQDFNNYVVVFLEWNLNTISDPIFNSLFNDVKSFVVSLNVNDSDFFDDFIKAAYYRIVNQSAEEYIFSLKDRVLRELEHAHMNATQLQLENNSLKQLTSTMQNEVDGLNKQMIEFSEHIKEQETRIQQFEDLNMSLEGKYQNQQQELLKIRNELHRVTQHHASIVSSLSWKMTKPFRVINEFIVKKK
ncbi:glycosyltransferase family 2 protein [Klebsiella sp. RHBSTW-00215]|uniref:glycosyltransferase family 2 protein n=1 Tax=Klebsiella sp. RHBSTW-00215 TaxID=2742640 RepID=UPI0015F3E65C|nr:glycosyltransferase [Klebsiella sp. RHBSTW-00215]MBA7934695.1 glycosyltransferase family 2 protein [Klebsiella sp. RHBSTW-00215]